jgi:hypothetical protein
VVAHAYNQNSRGWGRGIKKVILLLERWQLGISQGLGPISLDLGLSLSYSANLLCYSVKYLYLSESWFPHL